MSSSTTTSGPAVAGTQQATPGQRRSNKAAWIAWLIWALSIGFSATALLFLIATRSTPVPPAWGFRGYAILFSVSFATIGAIVASRRPDNPIGWIGCAQGLEAGIQALAPQYATYALIAKPGSLPGGAIAAWLQEWIWLIAIGPLASTTLLRFPNGRLVSERWRPLAWGIIGACILAVAAFAFAPGPMAQFAPVENPFGWSALAPYEAALNFAPIPVMIALVGSAASLVVRYRSASGEERHQIKWIAYVGAVFAVTIAINQVEVQVRGGGGTKSDLDVLVILTTMMIPVAIGVAVLKYRLYDIDLVINRTLVYGPLTAILAGAYIASIALFKSLFVLLTEENSEGAIILTTLVIAALFTPVKTRLQTFVDRRFKESRDPTVRLRAFRDQVRTVVQVLDAEALSRRLLEQTVTAFEARGGAIRTKRGDGMEEHALVLGDWDGHAAVSAPLDRAGISYGLLTLGPRKNGTDYTASDRQALRQAADLVAHAVSLAEGSRR